MDMKQEKSSHNALKVDQNVLDSFWVLAESNKKNINETTKSLVNSLLLKQKSNSSQVWSAVTENNLTNKNWQMS